MTTDINRIKKELKDCIGGADNVVKAQLVDESNLLHWKGEIRGPVGTPYEGGTFAIDIVLPSDYPFVPPKMRFDTRIWHPNISSESGAICLDILKNEWSPALTIRTALISLQALMSAPEPDDPQDAVVAKQYKEDYKKYCATAKYWTETYASAKPSEEQAVKNLMEMGFDAEKCRAALRKFDNDENQALDFLLQG
uniref:E2 ubiquitin-conjugating enzyme n=1 Tax=Chrysotila carterae TaxID=13221 RepID=A0A7S4C2K5_CHRCT|mmetsp:Transcript_52661/g.114885  ORF Transcript_52661/g.114885 Transcript_52661/m.114885 type:complete len:195 (-) Transcript_52661:617-1201(-)